mmetsp:Transcript_15732/g.38727  ORF Transcript_15732/g.38727 Transcript_15732/m.38727 type:complete len:217 (-) Transcript_15732:4637-5287(-)
MLSESSRISKSVSAPSSLGMVDRKSLETMSSLFSFDNFPIIVGIVPKKKFRLMYSDSSVFDSCNSSDGNVPFKSLSEMCKSRRLVALTRLLKLDSLICDKSSTSKESTACMLFKSTDSSGLPETRNSRSLGSDQMGAKVPESPFSSNRILVTPSSSCKSPSSHRSPHQLQIGASVFQRSFFSQNSPPVDSNKRSSVSRSEAKSSQCVAPRYFLSSR